MTVAVYWAGNLISKNEKRKKTIFGTTLFLLISNLLLHKYFLGIGSKTFFFSLDDATKILWPLGMSYITFRLIHYIVEAYRKNVPESSFVDFASYVLFFPTFLAGPVERFLRFQSQTSEKRNLDIFDINYGLFRIICGIIKKCIIADNLARVIMPVLHNPQNYTRAIIIFSIYGLAIRIYMGFSGYTDMAIGVARLFGYKIMENFHYPFFQKNIALFWRNWHISVYSWIRDYFFFPFFAAHGSSFKLYFGMIATMVVFHLWHSPSVNFLVLGAYHGIGLVIWRLFQEIKKKHPAIRNIIDHKLATTISTAFTFSFVSFGFVFFGFNIKDVLNIIRTVFGSS